MVYRAKYIEKYRATHNKHKILVQPTVRIYTSCCTYVYITSKKSKKSLRRKIQRRPITDYRNPSTYYAPLRGLRVSFRETNEHSYASRALT